MNIPPPGVDGRPPPPSPPRRPVRMTGPHPVTGRAVLQVVMVWRGQIIGYQLLDRRRKITVGPGKRATFITPPAAAGAGRFLLLAPRGNDYRLRLTPALRGELHKGSDVIPVADVLAEPAVGRHRGKGDVREVLLASGDRAKIVFADGSDLRLEIRWVDPAEHIPRPRVEDPTMVQTLIGTGIVLGMFAALLMLMWQKSPPKTLAISAERMAKIEAPVFEIVKKAAARKEMEKEEKKKQEEGQMKRAKEKAGKLGRADAKEKETVIPKGKEDILREKVSKIGLLGLIGKEKPQGSGLSKLFAANNDVEQAVAGMAGAKMVAGRGAGGLSTSGAGAGGGGTGFGHIYGAGNLDTGGRGTHGKGRGPKLAERGEKEVSVGLGNGGGEMDGSLSKEQINKVVRAHLAGVKYCYEKELQHKSGLSGGVDLYWVIQPDGNVQRASIKKTTMGDAAVEGCILRQVKQWQFPKAAGQTTVERYPFIFKGGT
jgi:hypothetical protein